MEKALFHHGWKYLVGGPANAFHIAQLLCYREKDNLCSLLDSGRQIFYWSKLTMLRSTSTVVSSGKERGVLSWTAAGNRAYKPTYGVGSRVKKEVSFASDEVLLWAKRLSNEGHEFEVLSSLSYLCCKLNGKRISDQRSKCWNAHGRLTCFDMLLHTLFLEYATETGGNKCKAVFYTYKQIDMRSRELFWPCSILAKLLRDVLDQFSGYWMYWLFVNFNFDCRFPIFLNKCIRDFQNFTNVLRCVIVTAYSS